MNKLKYGLTLMLMTGVLQAAATENKPEASATEEPLPVGAVARLGTLRFRHGDSVRCIALGADGESVISAAGKFVYVWDLATGKQRRRLVGHEDEVNAVACSRDGKRIASLSADGKIIIWDAAGGKELRRILAHTPSKHPVFRSWQMPGCPALAFTPDGRQLISRGSDNAIRMWDAASGEKKREFLSFSLAELRPSSGLGFVLSADGKFLACLEGKVEPIRLKLWEVSTGRVLKEWVPKGWIGGAAFSPDGKRIALDVGRNPSGIPLDLELWDIADMKKIRAFSLTEGERLLGFSPDGKMLVMAGERSCNFRDVQTGKIVTRIHPANEVGNFFLINQLLFCRDDKTLVSFSPLEHALRKWDRASGKELHSSGEAVAPVHCVFSSDGRFLACDSRYQTIRIWDKTLNKEVRRINPEPPLCAILFSPDSQLLATASSRDPIIHFWEVADGKRKRQINTPGNSITRIAWSGDGKLLATWAFQDPSILLCDPATGKQQRSLSCGQARIISFLFSPDSKMVVAACDNIDKGELLAWAVNTDRRQFSFEGPVPAGLRCLAFSPDGRTVAAGALDRSVYLWEVISGRKRAVLKTEEFITSLVFSPDGKILAAASNTSFNHNSFLDNSVPPDPGKPHPPRVHLWDVAAEKELPPLEGHRGSIRSLSFSPDGKLLATGSNDTTVLLWDATRFKINRPAEKQLRPEQLESLWADLDGTDAVKAYRAIRTLAAAPKASVAFLKRHLHPIEPADSKQVARLLADLDSEQFDKREKAMQKLEKLGDRAATELRKALADKPPLEVKRRIEQLLEKQNDAAHLRMVRALETLERIGTTEARELCAALAEGVADASLTREARATLRRMVR